MRFKIARQCLWCLGLTGMLLGCVLMLSPQLVQAQTKGQVATDRKAIDAAYKAEDVAFNRADAKGSMRSYAVNYVYATKSGGKYSRQKFQEHLTSMFKTAKNIRSRTVMECITLNGNRASVRIKTHTKMRLIDSDGKPRAYVGSEQRDDTWKKQGSKWLRTYGKQISISHTVDGKRLG